MNAAHTLFYVHVIITSSSSQNLKHLHYLLFFYLFILGVIIDTINSSDYIVSNVPGSVSISSEFDVLFTVVKTTVLLADINDFGAVNEVYKQCEL